MKKIFLLSAFAACCIITHAQQDVAATLKNIQHLADFKIIQVPDSIEFSSEQLDKTRPILLMFFNPDCDHCQKGTKELLAYKEELKNIQIIMTSSLSYSQIKTFYQDYNIASMPNIKMGQDMNYALGLKYRPTNYPAIFVYDAKGNLAKAFAGTVSVPTIIDALK